MEAATDTPIDENIFDLFETVDKKQFFSDALDPDINFFKSLNITSKYYNNEELSKLIETSPNNSFSILHINSRSLFHKVPVLEVLCGSTRNFFSILLITETWLTEDTAPLIILPGYTFVYRNRINGRGGGVAIFIRDDLHFRMRYDLCVANPVFDWLAIEMINQEGKKNIILNIYRPPDSDVDVFVEYLNVFLTSMNHKTGIYIGGDFNINLLDHGHLKTNFEKTLLEHNLLPTITRPTRMTRHSATLIDNIFTNKYSNNVNGILLEDLSDHFPIFTMSQSKLKLHKTSTCTRNLKPKNVLSLILGLEQIDWSIILSCNDTEEAFKMFQGHLTEVLNSTCPYHTVDRKLRRQEWITEEILKSSKIKHKLYVKTLKHPTTKNLEKYKKFRNIFTSIKREAEKSYYNTLFQQAKNDIKKTWTIIRKALNKSRPDSIERIFHNGQLIEDKLLLSNIFNEYFTSIGANTANTIPFTSTNNYKDYLVKPISESMFLEEITETEIVKIVNSFKNSRSTAIDDLSNSLLRSVINSISSPLCHIFNLSFKKGIFPEPLKVSKVIPIFKKGDKESLDNYRPISLLSPISKLLEKLMFNRITSFFNKHHIIHSNQFGFKANSSTDLALINLTQQILQQMNNKHLTVGVFIDLSKAFDTINHDILLDKISHYGIRGTAHLWFVNYLKDRSQLVSLGDIKSALRGISIGVPQGSILGPLLFNIFVNDIFETSKLLTTILYADDTNLFHFGDSVEEVTSVMNTELVKFSQWFSANRLKINIGKTNYIIFGPKIKLNALPPSCIEYDGISLPRVRSTKFLGITITESLSWTDHINDVGKKMSKSVGLLSRFRNRLNHDIICHLYYSLIYPHITYCNLIWGNSPMSSMRTLSVIQNCFVRMLYGLGRMDNVDNYIITLKMLTPRQIHCYSILVFMFKLMNNITHSSVFDNLMLSSDIRKRQTRHTGFFYLPYCRLKLLSTSVYLIGPKLWNLLPYHIRCVSSIYIFKILVKKFICEHNLQSFL